MLMKAVDADEDQQAATTDTTIGLNKGERLRDTVKQENLSQRLLGRRWLWRKPSSGTQLPG